MTKYAILQEMYAIPWLYYEMHTRKAKDYKIFGDVYCDFCESKIQENDRYFVSNNSEYRFCYRCYDTEPHFVNK